MEAKKLPVRFPNVVRKQIYLSAEELNLSPSTVARAAMILGMIEVKKMQENENYPGHTLAFVKSFGGTGGEEL